MHDLVVIALSSPLRIGVYDETGALVETVETDEKSSEALPLHCAALMQRYTFGRLFYARGPGSFMAIKISYLFLKTLSIAKNIPLLATDAFYFNENQPIKAVGKLCFVKTTSGIETQLFDEVPLNRFRLPKQLNAEDFETDSAPYYGIGAVG
jgi:tRNA A37 threonylcarbamoyladenosine modification protein TsaB